MVAIRSGKVMKRLSAISCSATQKAGSNRTLVLRPEMMTERGIVSDMQYQHLGAAENIHVSNAGEKNG